MRKLRRAGWIICFALGCPQLTAADSAYDEALAIYREGTRGIGGFENLIGIRREAHGEDAMTAKVTVLRHIADIEAEEERWRDALGHSRSALQIARHAQDAEQILHDGQRTAEFAFMTGERGEAAVLSRELAEMAEALGHTSALEAAWTTLARVHQVSGSRELAGEYFAKIKSLPPRDLFAILELEARGYAYSGMKHAPYLRELWTTALADAEASENVDRQITARRRLADLAIEREDRESARHHLDQIESLRSLSPATRSPTEWHTLAKFQIDNGEIEKARDSLRQGIKRATAVEDRDTRIVLRAELAGLLVESAPEAAYEELRAAYDERISIGRNQQTIKMTMLPPSNDNTELDEINELAAVRHALRDAELARTRARNQQIAAIAVAISLLAIVLMLAFLLKRRAAQAATLRAENAQLEALRYQLNPHFLFNSLANLNGLILTSPDRARQAIRRLSDFCRLALTRRESPFLTIAEEAQRLQAYLDVAQAAEDDDLIVTFTVDPATHDTQVPPLLIQPLIENALKYAEGDETDQRRVTISIAARSDKSTRIEVSNTGSWLTETHSRHQPSTGVGLANLRERLSHYYPNRHELTFEKTAISVTATLQLWAGAKYQFPNNK